jgi:tellurite resistance protein
MHPDIALLSPEGRRRIYRILCRLAACDHTIPECERRVLERYRAAFALDEVEARHLEAWQRAGGSLSVGDDALERDILAEGLIEVAAADGILDPNEHKMLLAFVGELDLPYEEFQERLLAALARAAEEGE